MTGTKPRQYRMTGKLFRGGVPTGPDVDRLMAQLDPTPGTIITYSEVENVTGIKHKEQRWHSVMEAWRSRLFHDRNLDLEPVGGEYFKVLTGDERVDAGIKGLHRVGRAAGRVVRKTESIDWRDLSETKMKQHTLLKRHAHALLSASQDAARAVAIPPGPVKGETLRLSSSLPTE